MNDMSPPLWARKGEAVTCTCGHVICHIARDIPFGAPRAQDGSDFCEWVQPQPPLSRPVAEICCQECRGFWLRGVQARGSVAYQFHFKEGWR